VSSSGDAGHLTLSALAFDGSEVPILELSTNNTVDWSSPSSDWLSSGNFTVKSSTMVEQTIDWDAYGTFEFNEGNYSVYVSDNELNGDDVFLAFGQGQYKGTWGNWEITVTDSECYINDVNQGSLTTALQWLNLNSFETVSGMFTMTVLGGSDEPLFYTLNQVTWLDLGRYGAVDLAEGVILTDTQINGNPEFALFSQFMLDQSNQTAAFSVIEILKGQMGLNASAQAFYDTDFGLLTGIDTIVSYDSDLIFQAHTSWDAQLQSLNTPVPTTSPTIAPTRKPTISPTVAPTRKPTMAPTVKPGAPTVRPTIQPTVAPSAKVTFAPTRNPSAMPTRTPTIAPSKQTTPILTFTSAVSLSGVTSTTLDQASQQAVVSAAATSMKISTSSVTYVSTSPTTFINSLRMFSNKKSVVVASYSVVANLKVSVPVTTSTSTEVYQSLTAQLSSAVTQGNFTTTLQQASADLGATETASAAATDVSEGPAEVTEPGSSGGSSSGLSAGAIAGIVIGVVGGLTIVAVALWFYLGRKSALNSAATSHRSTSNSVSSDPSRTEAVFSTDSTISKMHLDVKGDENL